MSAAVLISGGGSNLQSIIDQVASRKLDLDLALVLSNRSDAFGLERARKAGIPTECVRHQDFADRTEFDTALADCLDRYRPQLIVLAGFMRILTPVFISRFSGRVLNIHPSLLPKFPGLDTHQRAIDAREAWHGCTVHFVTEDLDGGPAIIQGRVPVRPGEPAGALAARVLEIEHRIYPEAARLYAAGRLEYRDGSAWLDGERLCQPLRYEGRISEPGSEPGSDPGVGAGL